MPYRRGRQTAALAGLPGCWGRRSRGGWPVGRRPTANRRPATVSGRPFRRPPLRPSRCYGMTFSIVTLPVPATVPRALTSWTRPKNSRPSGAAAAAVTVPDTVAESPVPSFTGVDASTATAPSADEKNTSR